MRIGLEGKGIQNVSCWDQGLFKFLMFDWPIAALNTFCAECERAALQKSWTKLHPELTQMCQKQELGSV